MKVEKEIIASARRMIGESTHTLSLSQLTVKRREEGVEWLYRVCVDVAKVCVDVMGPGLELLHYTSLLSLLFIAHKKRMVVEWMLVEGITRCPAEIPTMFLQ